MGLLRQAHFCFRVQLLFIFGRQLIIAPTGTLQFFTSTITATVSLLRAQRGNPFFSQEFLLIYSSGIGASLSTSKYNNVCFF